MISPPRLSLPAILVAIVSFHAVADTPPRLAPGKAGEQFAIVDQPATLEVSTAKPGYADLLKRITPSVVSVFPARVMKESAEDNPLQRFFNPGGKEESPKDRERIQGLGSGVILSADGWIITNSHVVHLANGRVADAIFVELSDRRRFPARVAGVDAPTDLALLKIEAAQLPHLPIGDSDAVAIGDLVFAIGNPFQVGMTATMGMVSAKQRSVGINGPGGFEDFIQTDAAINPGNSGGALVDANGRLIGINSAIYSGRGGNVGIGFAIPSRLMREIAIRLAEEGTVNRGFFGLQLEEVDSDAANTAKLERIAGAKVSAVMEGGPAASAGLQAGDVIVKVGGQDADTRARLRMVLSLIKPGQSVAVEFIRAGERKTATLAARESAGAKETGLIELTPLPGAQFRMRGDELVVANLTTEAKRRTQLEVGMVILEVNGSTTKTPASVETALRRGVNRVKARTEEGERTLAIRIE